jgi:hypothetical protein
MPDYLPCQDGIEVRITDNSEPRRRNPFEFQFLVQDRFKNYLCIRIVQFGGQVIVFRSADEALANPFTMFETKPKVISRIAMKLRSGLFIMRNRAFDVFIKTLAPLRTTTETIYPICIV